MPLKNLSVFEPKFWKKWKYSWSQTDMTGSNAVEYVSNSADETFQYLNQESWILTHNENTQISNQSTGITGSNAKEYVSNSADVAETFQYLNQSFGKNLEF